MMYPATFKQISNYLAQIILMKLTKLKKGIYLKIKSTKPSTEKLFFDDETMIT